MKVRRYLRALVATLLYAVRLQRIAEKFDPVMQRAEKCQEIKTPNYGGEQPPQTGV